MYFFKAFALLITFLLSVSRGGDEWRLECLDPQVRDEGMAVSFSWENEGRMMSRLFSLNFAGEEKLAEYPCFEVADEVPEEERHYEGKLVLMDCYRPQSWDMGYDVLLVEDPDSGHRSVYVHELSLAGPLLRGKLACDGNWNKP